MKRIVKMAVGLLSCVCISYHMALGDCTPRTVSGPTLLDGTSQGCGWDSGQDGVPNFPPLTKKEARTIAWPDGYKVDVTATSTGECRLYYPNCHWNFELGFCSNTGSDNWNDPISFCYRQYFQCWPEFFPPDYSSNGNYQQTIYRATGKVNQVLCGSIINDDKETVECQRGAADDSVTQTHTCPKSCD